MQNSMPPRTSLAGRSRRQPSYAQHTAHAAHDSDTHGNFYGDSPESTASSGNFDGITYASYTLLEFLETPMTPSHEYSNADACYTGTSVAMFDGAGSRRDETEEQQNSEDEEYEYDDDDEDEEDTSEAAIANRNIDAETVPPETQQPRQPEDLQGPLLDGNKFATAARQGIDELLELLYNTEIKAKRAAMLNMPLEEFMMAGHSIIATMFTKVLVELIAGNLPLAVECDPTLKKSMMALKNRSVAKHPGCYVRFLTDSDGLSPTPNELREGIRVLRAYAEPDEDGLTDRQLSRIETQVGQYNGIGPRKHGGRRYLSHNIDQKKYDLKPSRVEAVQTFSDRLLEILDAMPDDQQDKPFPTPLKYVGYAKDCTDRNMNYHNKHNGSNFLMCLFEAIMLSLFQKRYKMHWWVVLLLRSPDEASGAEIIISALTEGYVESGLGFAHHSAGETTFSHKKTVRKGKEYGVEKSTWGYNYQWILRNTPFRKNMKALERGYAQSKQEYDQTLADTKEIDERIKAIDDEMEQLERDSYLRAQAQTEVVVHEGALLDNLNDDIEAAIEGQSGATPDESG